MSVIPENTNEVIDYVAFAFVYGYNKNTMTAYNAMLNIAQTNHFDDASEDDSSEGSENLESGGAGAEIQSNGHGFSASIGCGASIAPIPYFQVKFGYTWVWYWNIKKTKNNKSYTKSIGWIPNSKFKLTKKSSYTNIYVYKMKKTIRVYYKSKKVKIY